MFEQSLQIGKVGESLIASWLRARGHHVLPVYEIEKNQFKGPAIYSAANEEIIATDMLVFGKETIWIEAKHKSAFSWHRQTQAFVTGIDLHHYAHYQKLRRMSDWPIWLLFLQQGRAAKDSPESPSGLYGHDLSYLIHHEHHRHANHGKTGMVYWAIDQLKKMDSIENVMKGKKRE